MKYHQLLAIRISPKLGLVALLCFLVAGCHIFAPPPQHFLGGQPGDYLIAELKSAEAVKNRDISDIKQISAVLQSAYERVSIPKPTIELLKKHPELSAKLIKSMSQGYDVEHFLSEQTNKDAKAQQTAILLGVKLFPVDSYRILQALALNNLIKNTDVIAVVRLEKLDPRLIFTNTTSQDKVIKIEPLFHSASVTLYNQKQTNSAKVQYKVADSDVWLDALPLQ